jgi:hypothetical protein
LSLADGVAMKDTKPENTHLNSNMALPPCLETERGLHQEQNILCQYPKSVKNCQKSSRTKKRLFSHNGSVNVDEHVENSLHHFSVDDSLGLEITGNYNISLMMRREMVPKTAVFNELTWLISQETTNFSRHESFTTYISLSHLFITTGYLSWKIKLAYQHQVKDT